MNKITYKVLKAVIAGAMGGVIGLSFAMGLKYLPFIALVIGTGFMLILALYKPRELKPDERINKIVGRAAIAAYQVFTLTIAVAGLILMTLFDSQAMKTIGTTILYSACWLILLYLGFYFYYNKKSEL
ncbi:DUF2178 domain-containing protein [Candidatus Woesearchaeota archaeon]|nr:DUF2178 domain-containing protein [Candidatus Woesearchaeota archaeon]